MLMSMLIPELPMCMEYVGMSTGPCMGWLLMTIKTRILLEL